MAKFEFQGIVEGTENYAVYIADCTSFRVSVADGKVRKIFQILQAPSVLCEPKKGILDERVQFLIQNGFTLKESKFKNNNSTILVKDNNNEFLFVVWFNFNGGTEEVEAIHFKLFNKRKYPIFQWL
jgi:hypothetical protein